MFIEAAGLAPLATRAWKANCSSAGTAWPKCCCARNGLSPRTRIPRTESPPLERGRFVESRIGTASQPNVTPLRDPRSPLQPECACTGQGVPAGRRFEPRAPHGSDKRSRAAPMPSPLEDSGEHTKGHDAPHLHLSKGYVPRRASGASVPVATAEEPNRSTGMDQRGDAIPP